ncbi:MAG: lipopolysaccharide heptosyltransferase II [Halanaerobiaceae bacterium]
MEKNYDFIQDKKINKILVTDLLYLGDIIFALPFFKNLRKNFPEARIDLIMNHKFYNILENYPYLNKIYPYNKNWSIKKSLKFALNIKKEKYDLGLNIHGNWRTTILMKLISPEVTAGYGDRFKKILLNKKITPPSSSQHMVDVYLDFLKKIGCSLSDKSQEINPDKKAETKIKKFLNRKGLSGHNLIGLNPGGSWTTKRWDKEKFARLGDLIQKRTGYKVVLTGGEGDIQRVNEIARKMESTPLITAGKTNLQELAALWQKCQAVISGDTGPVHVAAAVGTPTLTIFGPSDEKKYRPQSKKGENIIIKADIDCRPCGKHECLRGDHKCMDIISPEAVYDKVFKELI